MKLSTTEQTIQQSALEFARANKKRIAKEITDTTNYPSELHPVSVFMAGSPGAGKTEASIALLGRAPSGVIRIDPDSLRDYFEDYNGSNSYLFQKAISVLVDKVHDTVLSQQQSFLLDGTLSGYSIASKNIERSLKKQRTVQILYVYQEPKQAWKFVCAREVTEGRRILPEHFIKQYYQAREVVNQLKLEYRDRISLDLILKNVDGSVQQYIGNASRVDDYIPEKYTQQDIEKIIRLS